MTFPRPLRQPSVHPRDRRLTDLLRDWWIRLWADNEINGPGSEQ